MLHTCCAVANFPPFKDPADQLLNSITPELRSLLTLVAVTPKGQALPAPFLAQLWGMPSQYDAEATANLLEAEHLLHVQVDDDLARCLVPDALWERLQVSVPFLPFFASRGRSDKQQAPNSAPLCWPTVGLVQW